MTAREELGTLYEREPTDEEVRLTRRLDQLVEEYGDDALLRFKHGEIAEFLADEPEPSS